MHRLIGLLIFLLLACSCGVAPEPSAETRSAFTCAHISTFTRLCTQWVPGMIPGSPTNYVPAGDPQWCPLNNSAIPDGWAMVFNDQPVSTNRYCAFVPAGNYGTLGDWDYASPSPALVPSVHVRSILTGAHAYAFVWAAPNFGGDFVGFYGPGSVVNFTSVPGSFEVVDGQ